jgi:hypothetical protein
MHELYELKEMLCKELEEYGQKGELTAGSLEVVDKLANTIKNLCKIIEMCEDDEYSSRDGSYEDGMGGSYARGGRGGNRGGGGANQYGSYAMGGRSYARGRGGRYSRDGGMIEDLRELMQDAPDERTRQEFQKFIRKIEGM